MLLRLLIVENNCLACLGKESRGWVSGFLVFRNCDCSEKATSALYQI